MGKIKKIILLTMVFISCSYSQNKNIQFPSAEMTTNLLYDKINFYDSTIVNSTYMIYCRNTGMKGTGFLVKNGPIITNAHVIKDAGVENIIAQSAFGVQIHFEDCKIDTILDLAALITKKRLPSDGLELGKTNDFKIGDLVETWGYPLKYSGPPPILSVGYFSGFNEYIYDKKSIFRYVINAAFNSGNSGGVLVRKNSNKIIGVVVAKALPIYSPFVAEAVKAFADNQSGVIFSGRNEKGETITFTESNLVAEIVNNLREMYQVVIGEAIMLEDLIAFLKQLEDYKFK